MPEKSLKFMRKTRKIPGKSKNLLFTDRYPSQGGENGKNYFDTDAKTFAEWGIDSLKFDVCHSDLKTIDGLFPKMEEALNKTGQFFT